MLKKISKTGTSEQLKERIVQEWLANSSDNDVFKYAGMSDLGKAPDTPAAPSGPPHAPAAPSSPSEAPAAPSASSAAPSDPSNSGTASADLSLFGRGTFALVPSEVEDRTTFFTGIQEGPALKDQDAATSAEILEEATDGVLPLAALVKVSQGFQEAVEEQVAILLAGMRDLSEMFTRRALVPSQHALVCVFHVEVRQVFLPEATYINAVGLIVCHWYATSSEVVEDYGVTHCILDLQKKL